MTGVCSAAVLSFSPTDVPGAAVAIVVKILGHVEVGVAKTKSLQLHLRHIFARGAAEVRSAPPQRRGDGAAAEGPPLGPSQHDGEILLEVGVELSHVSCPRVEGLDLPAAESVRGGTREAESSYRCTVTSGWL